MNEDFSLIWLSTYTSILPERKQERDGGGKKKNSRAKFVNVDAFVRRARVLMT